MPVHDWTRAEPGTFHDFHRTWTVAISNALNTGGLPERFYAMLAKSHAGEIMDGKLLERLVLLSADHDSPSGVAVADDPPRTRFITRAVEQAIYARRANRIVVRHHPGQVVAVIEIISPGNKSNTTALHSLVTKTHDLIEQGIHLLIVDLFPPSRRDPQGIHAAIWDEICEQPFTLPDDKPLTLAAYLAGPLPTAYVEPVAVGDELPSMPIFLTPDSYVNAPLESTYQTTWAVCPKPMQERLA